MTVVDVHFCSSFPNFSLVFETRVLCVFARQSIVSTLLRKDGRRNIRVVVIVSGTQCPLAPSTFLSLPPAMVRLTVELVHRSPQCTNCLGERQLNLRGCGLQVLESQTTAASATAGRQVDLLLDLAQQFDVWDLSDNHLMWLDGLAFPPRPVASTSAPAAPAATRLSTLILHNNRIHRISVGTARSLASSLHTLLLHHNQIQCLPDLLPLRELHNLERLSLVGNPVTQERDYRVATIAMCGPKLKLLDFNRVLQHERVAAETWKAANTGLLRPTPDASDDSRSTLAARDSTTAVVGAANDDAPKKWRRRDRVGAALVSETEHVGAKRQRSLEEAATTPAVLVRLSQHEYEAQMAKLMERMEAASALEEIEAVEREVQLLDARRPSS